MLNEGPFRPPRLLDPRPALRVNTFVATSEVVPFATMPFPVLNTTSDPSSTVLLEPNLTRSLLGRLGIGLE